MTAPGLHLPGDLPRVPVSAGALLRDESGLLLVCKPTYKSGWTLPGGQMEADGETPWEACRREVLEECGVEVVGGRLRCVDFLRPRPGRAGGLRLLFDCGVLTAEVVASIVPQPGEIAECRFVEDEDADRLLSGPVRRRVQATRTHGGVVYLEDGLVVDGVHP